MDKYPNMPLVIELAFDIVAHHGPLEDGLRLSSTAAAHQDDFMLILGAVDCL
jgi:hypothetical protein